MISSFVFARTSTLLAAAKHIASGAAISKTAIAATGGVAVAGYSYQYSKEKQKNEIISKVLRGTEEDLHVTKQNLSEEKALTRRLKRETKALVSSNQEIKDENNRLVETCDTFKDMYVKANERSDLLAHEIGAVRNELLSEIRAVKTENQELNNSVLELNSKIVSLETTGTLLKDKVRSLEANNTSLSNANASLLAANTQLQNRLQSAAIEAQAQAITSAADTIASQQQVQEAITGAVDNQKTEISVQALPDQQSVSAQAAKAATQAIESGSSQMAKDWKKEWLAGMPKSTQRTDAKRIETAQTAYKSQGSRREITLYA